LDAGAWRQALANQSSHKLNEHGPALNVFWTRKSELGAAVFRKKNQDKDGEAFNKKKAEAFPDLALELDG
jgi:hypothetical protein